MRENCESRKASMLSIANNEYAFRLGCKNASRTIFFHVIIFMTIVVADRQVACWVWLGFHWMPVAT